MKKYIKKIWELYKPFRKTIVFLFALILMVQAIQLLPPIIYAKLVDSVFLKNSLQKSLYLVAYVFLLEMATIILYQIKGRMELKYTDFDIERHIYNKNLDKILKFSIGQNENDNSGIKQSVLDRGTNSMQQATNYTLYQAAPLFFKVFSAVIAMLIINLILGGVALLGVILYISVAIYMNSKFKNFLKELEEMYNNLGKEYTEILRNIPIVKINSQEELSKKRYGDKFSKICDFGRKTWMKYMDIIILRDGIGGVANFIIMLLGVWFVFQGMYTPGTLIIFWSWSSRAFADLGEVGKMQREYMGWGASIKKYFDLMDMEPDIKEIENPVKLVDVRGEIEFRDVVFKYPYRAGKDDCRDVKSCVSTEEPPLLTTPVPPARSCYSVARPKRFAYRCGRAGGSSEKRGHLPKEGREDVALKGVSFKIGHGQKVAFVGESGAGKSTIIQLLIRAYDITSGSVLIDGVDLKNLDLSDYRRKLGVVPQDVGVFDRTLRENIVFGLDNFEDVTDKYLDHIASLSCIDRFKHRLEHGYDTIIGEKGIKLSGGERQRVGIARALIKDPAILIFDEATSHLDTENEKLIHDAIDKISEGRTTIIIAHRLSTIKDADKIFVMDKGKIAGEGTHEELLKTCDAYKKLVSHQTVTV